MRSGKIRLYNMSLDKTIEISEDIMRKILNSSANHLEKLREKEGSLPRLEVLALQDIRQIQLHLNLI